jgi:hypothetical protein
MSRGGARSNAGRKVGAKNKLSERIEEAAKGGELPHEFLLRVSRGEHIQHGNNLILPDFKTRLRAAEIAASYYAPKLALVEQRVEQDVNHVISGELLTDEEFETKYIKTQEE